MIGHDVVNAALEGMTLVFETFSKKGRKMPRLSIKTSDKNLIKVASFAGLRKDWCSYWIVPAIPESGTISVPSGFQFTIRAGADKDRQTLFIQNTAHSSGLSLAEGDYVLMVAASFKPDPAKGAERIYPIDKGVYVCNAAYFDYHWVPGELGDKSIPVLIAKGTLIDTESKDYKGMEGLHSALESSATTTARNAKPDPVWHPLENSVFDSEESAQSHPDFKDFDHIVINQKNPSNRHLHLMRMLLREKGYAVVKEGEAIPSKDDSHEQENTFSHVKISLVNPSKDELQLMERILHQQGRAVIDTLNPSKDDLSLAIKLLMERSYLIYRKGETGFSDLAWMKSLLRAEGYRVLTDEEWRKEAMRLEDGGYESGYAAASRANRRREKIYSAFATRAYQVGFDAGRMVERLGILKGEENDRTEAELPPARDSAPEDARSRDKVARHGANFRIGTEGFRESESRSRSATQWADSEQPIYADERLTSGEEVPETHGDSLAERNENEKGDA